MFLYALESYLKPGFTKFGRIEISHPDYSKVADLRIVDGHEPLPEYRDSTTKSMQFIMLKETFTNPRVYIQVDTTEKVDGGEQFIEMFGDGDEIIRHMGKKWENSAQWNFDYPNRKTGTQLYSNEYVTKVMTSYLQRRLSSSGRNIQRRGGCTTN